MQIKTAYFGNISQFNLVRLQFKKLNTVKKNLESNFRFNVDELWTIVCLFFLIFQQQIKKPQREVQIFGLGWFQ